MPKLEIIDLDKKTSKPLKKIKDLPEELPKPPFRLLLAGTSNSGKSTFLCNLFRKEFYGKKMWRKNHVFVWSPTCELDPKIKDLIPSNQFYTDYDDGMVQSIYDEQHSILKEYGKKRLDHVLLIFDDCLTSEALMNNSAVAKNIFKTRHYNVSIVISVQKYTGVPRIIRLNCDYICIFKCLFGEIDSILSEQTHKDGKNKLKEALLEIFNTPFEFLMIDYRTQDMDKRYRKGLYDYIGNILK